VNEFVIRIRTEDSAQTVAMWLDGLEYEVISIDVVEDEQR
jgi:hypothetical protein